MEFYSPGDVTALYGILEWGEDSMYLKNRESFTLVELLTVIVIIGILSGILLPVLGKAAKRGKISRVTSELTNLAQVVLLVESDTGYLVNLEFLDNDGTGGSAAADDAGNTVIPSIDANGAVISIRQEDWNGPYITFREIGANRRPEDRFGNEYELDVSGTPYRIRSLGPDKDDDGWAEYDKTTGNGDIVYRFH